MSTDKLILILLISSPLASAQGELEPQNVSKNITAGSSYSLPYTVEWKGNQATRLDLNYSIEAKETSIDGVRAKLSRKSIELSPGESRDFSLILNTSFGLKPDKFVFSVNVENISSVSEPGKIGTGSGSSAGGMTATAKTGEKKEQDESNVGLEAENTSLKDNKTEKRNRSKTGTVSNTSAEDYGSKKTLNSSNSGTGLFSGSASLKSFFTVLVSGFLLIMAYKKGLIRFPSL
jgi:hypothetical protein